MMEGGKIEIDGSAGDYVGAPYRGSTHGIKGGSIIIHGDAGNETGSFMRGGLIIIDGNVGEFLGIHMKKGSILISGNSSNRAGAQMLGGKIILCGKTPSILPTFSIESVKTSTKFDGDKILGPFYLFTGDIAEGGKGKLYVSKILNPHLLFYEKYL
jgi:formylmethanofuran dehydrogenase subunit C